MHIPRSPTAQRGVTLIGLLFWAVLVGFIALMGIRSFPSVNEYLTIRRAVNQILQQSPTSPAEVRRAFDKQREIDYVQSDFTGKDLQIATANDKLTVRFAYEREVEVFGPVSLLIRYQGGSN